MNNATPPLSHAYQYFTLREWRIINNAMIDLLPKVQDGYIIDDVAITIDEAKALMLKLPSMSWGSYD